MTATVKVRLSGRETTLHLHTDTAKRRQWREAAGAILGAARDGRLSDPRWVIASILHGLEDKPDASAFDRMRDREAEDVLEVMIKRSAAIERCVAVTN